MKKFIIIACLLCVSSPALAQETSNCAQKSPGIYTCDVKESWSATGDPVFMSMAITAALLQTGSIVARVARLSYKTEELKDPKKGQAYDKWGTFETVTLVGGTIATALTIGYLSARSGDTVTNRRDFKSSSAPLSAGWSWSF